MIIALASLPGGDTNLKMTDVEPETETLSVVSSGRAGMSLTRSGLRARITPVKERLGGTYLP